MASEPSVLITGCSSGIGLDAARTLRARGWRVLATCRTPEDCARYEQMAVERLGEACAHWLATGEHLS